MKKAPNKITSMDLLLKIIALGDGEHEERRLTRELDISHGQFYELRKALVDGGYLVITHPYRAAHYHVPAQVKKQAPMLPDEPLKGPTDKTRKDK